MTGDTTITAQYIKADAELPTPQEPENHAPQPPQENTNPGHTNGLGKRTNRR